jgi:hypothetical protein
MVSLISTACRRRCCSSATAFAADSRSRYPGGDVDAGATHPDRLAGLVVDDLAVGREVPHLPVGSHDPLEHLVRLTRLVGLLMDRPDPFPVVRVDQRQEPLVRRFERLGLVAVDPEQLVGPSVGVGGDVPVIVAHVGQRLRVVDPLPQVGQRRLGSGLCSSRRLDLAVCLSRRHPLSVGPVGVGRNRGPVTGRSVSARP